MGDRTPRPLPCPFCGGKAFDDVPWQKDRPILLGCSPCDIWFKDMEWSVVVADWNRRAPVQQEVSRDG